VYVITEIEALPNREEIQRFIESQAQMGLRADFVGATKVHLIAIEKLTEDSYSILTYTNCLNEETETAMIHDDWTPHLLARCGSGEPFWIVKLRLYVLKTHHYTIVQDILEHTDALEEAFQRKKQAF